MKHCAAILIVGFIFALCLAGYKTFLSLTHPIKYQNEIVYYAKEYNLEPEIVASIINIESSYNKKAKSNKDAIGLMQIKLDTANYLNELYYNQPISENQLFDTTTNIKYGCMYLRYLLNKFEDLNTTLCAYNAGETRVRSWLNSDYSTNGKTLNKIPYTETKNYLIKFKENYKFYKKIY